MSSSLPLRILLPTDMSMHAMHAAIYAVKLFGQKAIYSLVYAHFDGGLSMPMDIPYAPEMMATQRDGLATAAKRFVEMTGARNVEQHLLFGALPTALKSFAEDTEADAIVMGRRGEGASRFFGSNTTDVIKSSPVPVLAVPEKARLQAVQRILLADDHDTVRPETLALLRSIAEEHDAEVLVAHYSTAVDSDTKHWSNAQYDAALKGIPHAFIGMHGKDVIDGLERTAVKRKADLIAVVHRHTGLLDGIFHASVAKEMAETSESPLLVLEQMK
ncbi:MAG: universal stress protein [Flavobacteriales bacterium]|nr:universal stress protein [Flavobacteriales bacterium]